MRRSLPSLNGLRAFEVAARHESLSRAAESLNVTHGSISKHVKKLEESLGVRLFERRPRRLVLTAQGRSLFESTQKAFDIIEGGLNGVRRRKRINQRLAVLCDPDFASLWLLPRIVELRDVLGGAPVDIEPIAEPKREIPHRGDCAIWFGSRAGRGLQTQKVFRSTLFPVFSPGLSTSTCPLRTPSDLRYHTLLHYRDTEEWRRYCEVAAVSQIEHEEGEIFGAFSLTLDATLRGIGIAIGDNFLCAQHLREGKLQRLFGPSFASSNSYFLSLNPFSSRHALVDVFKRWLKASR